MTESQKDPYRTVVVPMLTGPRSVTQLRDIPEPMEKTLRYIVQRMMKDNKSPYEIAEAIAWVAASRFLKSTDLMTSIPNTPLVMEVFIRNGCPNPYDEPRMLFPLGMDERLLTLIPTGRASDETNAMIKRIAKVLHEEEVVMIENRFFTAPSMVGGTYYFEYDTMSRRV